MATNETLPLNMNTDDDDMSDLLPVNISQADYEYIIAGKISDEGVKVSLYDNQPDYYVGISEGCEEIEDLLVTKSCIIDFLSGADGTQKHRFAAELLAHRLNEMRDKKSYKPFEGIKLSYLEKSNVYAVTSDSEIYNGTTNTKEFWADLSNALRGIGYEFIGKTDERQTLKANFPDTINSLQELIAYSTENKKEIIKTSLAEITEDINTTYDIEFASDLKTAVINIDVPSDMTILERVRCVDEYIRHFEQDEKISDLESLSLVPHPTDLSRFSLRFDHEKLTMRDIAYVFVHFKNFFDKRATLRSFDESSLAKKWQNALHLPVSIERDDDTARYVIQFPKQDNGLGYNHIGLVDDPRDLLLSILQSQKEDTFTTVDYIHDDDGYPSISVQAGFISQKRFNPSQIGDQFIKSLSSHLINIDLDDAGLISSFSTAEDLDGKIKILKNFHKAFDDFDQKPELIKNTNNIVFDGQWAVVIDDDYQYSNFYNDLISGLEKHYSGDLNDIKETVTVDYDFEDCHTTLYIDPNVIEDNPDLSEVILKRWKTVFNKAQIKNKFWGVLNLNQSLVDIEKHIKKYGGRARFTMSSPDQPEIRLDFLENSDELTALFRHQFYKTLNELTDLSSDPSVSDILDFSHDGTDVFGKSNTDIRFPVEWLNNQALRNHTLGNNVMNVTIISLTKALEDQGLALKCNEERAWVEYSEEEKKTMFSSSSKRPPVQEVMQNMIAEIG